MSGLPSASAVPGFTMTRAHRPYDAIPACARARHSRTPEGPPNRVQLVTDLARFVSSPRADEVAPVARQRRFLDAGPDSFMTNAMVETNAPTGATDTMRRPQSGRQGGGEQMATLDEIGQERQRISERLGPTRAARRTANA